jgi:hypothetical protein
MTITLKFLLKLKFLYFADEIETVYLIIIYSKAKNKPFYANSLREKQLIYFLFYKELHIKRLVYMSFFIKK